MYIHCVSHILPPHLVIHVTNMLFTHSNGGRGRGRARGRFGQGQGGRGPTYNNNSQFRPQNGSQRGTFARRGSFHSGPSRQNATECGYCGKLGHHEEECRKKMRESASTSRQLTNYAHNSDYEEYTGTYEHNSDYEDRGGMYARNSDRGGMFMMKHRANSMSASTSTMPSIWRTYGLFTPEPQTI